MVRYKVGQVVKIKSLSGQGIIIAECKEPKNHWCVTMTKRTGLDKQIIMIVDEKHIKPYKNKCWNHTKCRGKVDSSIDDTCEECGWVRCRLCGECKENGCNHKDRGYEILDAQTSLDHINREHELIHFDESEFDDWEKITVK